MSKSMGMSIRAATLAAMLVVTGGAAAAAQSAAEHVALGDREHAAMNAAAALAHYEQALAIDSADYAANWKAAREAVDLGEFDQSKDERTRFYRNAERYARRAVALMPQDAEGHFQLARAIGRNALTMGTRDRIKFAKEVRSEALAALQHDPKHPGALHVMGMWNAEVMRLSGLSRMIAKTFLGGQIFGEASWKEAVRYMEESAAAEPGRLVHHLDLGQIYADVGEPAKAREQLELVVRGTPTEFNDRHYKTEAEQKLRELR
jgi:tetratricopeptide (TPR) repeat protein